MKKGMTIGLATLLVVGSISPAVLAAEVKNAPEILLAATKDKKKDKENERIVERAVVESLTLEEAIRYGLNSDYSLMELEYQIQKLKTTEDKLEDSFDVAESSLESARAKKEELQKKYNETSKDTVTVDVSKEINNLVTSLDSVNIDVGEIELEDGTSVPTSNAGSSLESTIAYLKQFLNSVNKYMDEYQKYQQSALLKEQLGLIDAQVQSLQNLVTTLENSLDDIELNQTTVFNNRVQMRESMEVSISSTFLGLIMTQDQLDFMRHSLEVQQSQINATQKRYELGLVSRKDYEKATREITDLETQIAQTEKQLKNNKRAFALSIGVTYNEDLNIVKPEIGEISLVTQSKSTEELIKNSYNMVNARTELRLAEDALDEVDDKEGRVKEDEELAEIEVDIAKLKMESLEVDLEEAVNKIYFQVDQQYQAMTDAEKDLEIAKQDNGDLQIYYDLGLVSKQEFESANTSVKQAELNYNNAKYQYYLVTKQVELMEAGVIPTN